MGFCVEKGERFERTCRACEERVVIVGSGSDLCRCPYCGCTLMDHDGSDPAERIPDLSRALLRFRAAAAETREGLKPSLESSLLWMLDDLTFFGKDQRRWHDYRCACGWSGYWPREILPDGKGRPGKAVCPACQGENVRYVPGRG